jgi:oligoribonuclease (3'-5' exoribonuclease)
MRHEEAGALHMQSTRIDRHTKNGTHSHIREQKYTHAHTHTHTNQYVKVNMLRCLGIKGVNTDREFNLLHFMTEMYTYYVYCAVRTESLCVLCGSENKQRLFPYIALTDWFL